MILELGQKNITNEILIIEDKEVSLLKYNFIFNDWLSINDFDNYNGKKILEYNNEPLFAELLILRLLEIQGYKGVWVDTYKNKFWQRLPHLSFPVLINDKIKERLELIYNQKGGKKSGCFDVVAYKNEEFIFVELKRKNKDKIQSSQMKWLKAGLDLGIKKHNFIIAEWDINP